MTVRFIILLLLTGVGISGCTNAGPFVTDIAYDGEGNLLVTKNMVTFNWFFGTIHTGENEQTIVIKTPKPIVFTPDGTVENRKIIGYRAIKDTKTGEYRTVPVYEDENQ